MLSLEPKKHTTFIIFAMSKSHFFLKFAVFVLRTFCFVLDYIVFEFSILYDRSALDTASEVRDVGIVSSINPTQAWA